MDEAREPRLDGRDGPSTTAVVLRPVGELRGESPTADVPPMAPAARSSAADEITLGFGMGLDPAGRSQPLSDSLVLATVLCAVDAQRTQPAFVWSRPGEVVEALAPVYWPLLVLPAPIPGRKLIFDGTGVWHETFQHSRMPPVQSFAQRLANPPPSPELAVWLRELRAPLLFQGIPDSMSVAGLLPVNLPLFADILAQTGFRSDPSTPHAAFLPTRHPISWFESAVNQIGESVQRIDTELGQLSELRAAVERLLHESSSRLDQERRQLQLDLTSRSRLYATEEMERDVDSVHGAIRDQIHAELDRIRAANVTIAEARASGRVAEALAQRASARREETSALRARIRAANETERRQFREIRDAQARIGSLHERERESYTILTERVAVVEQHAADELSTHELLRDDVVTSARELLAAFDAQLERRRNERDQLAGHLLELPALEGIQTLWFPLWIATLVGPSGARCLVFPPMRVRDAMGVGASIKTLFGGVVLPLEPRTAQFGQTLRVTLEETIRGDPWLFGVTRQLVLAADTTADPAFLQRLALGLQELRLAGWISADQERRYFAASSQHLRARPVGVPGSGAVPAPVLPPARSGIR